MKAPSVIGPVSATDDVGKILVIAYGHTADTLPAGPCLAALRAMYPTARLHMLVVQEVADLWRACPYVDEVRVLRDFRWKGTRFSRPEQLLRLAQLTAQLRGRYDMVIALHARSSFLTRLTYLSGARYRAGYRDNHPSHWLTHEAEQYDEIVPFREENRRVLAALGITVTQRRLEIWSTPEAETEAQRVLSPAPPGQLRVAIHPGSHWACQRWHNERWAEVADGLVEAYGAHIIITGSADESVWAEEIAERMHTRPIIATGATSILGFAEVIRQCDALICVNSAASQVGLAVQTPVINLVGLEPLTWTQAERGENMTVVRECSASSTSWCPLGIWGKVSQCQREDHVGLAGLDGIQPHHVLAAAQRLRPVGTP